MFSKGGCQEEGKRERERERERKTHSEYNPLS